MPDISQAKENQPQSGSTASVTARWRLVSIVMGVMTALAVLILPPVATAQEFNAAKNAYLKADYSTALSIARPLADKGDPEAMVLLSLMYDNGQGVPRDEKQATEWLTKAADKNHSNAQHDLGLRYYQGQGVAQSYQKASEWWQKAADSGIVDSQFNLALIYYRGLGTEQNFAKARELFKKAADQGHDHAQYSLAVMHAFGHGGPIDYNKALRLFQQAANRNVAQAQYNLGVFYENGYAVTKDLGEARRWYRLASRQNLEEARLRLALLEESPSPTGVGAPPASISRELQPQRQTRPTTNIARSAPAVSPPPAAAPAPAPARTATTGTGGNEVLREDWLRQQPGKNYTLQIVSVTSEAKMLDFLGRYNWSRPIAYAKVLINGQQRYNALYGSYASIAAAKQAISELPVGLRTNQPWPRRFEQINRLVSP